MLKRKRNFWLREIEVPRPYHLEIDGRVYDLRWIKLTLEVVAGLFFLLGLYGIWFLLVIYGG